MIDINAVLFAVVALVTFLIIAFGSGLWIRADYRHRERMAQMGYDRDRDVAAWKAGEAAD